VYTYIANMYLVTPKDICEETYVDYHILLLYVHTRVTLISYIEKLLMIHKSVEYGTTS